MLEGIAAFLLLLIWIWLFRIHRRLEEVVGLLGVVASAARRAQADAETET